MNGKHVTRTAAVAAIVAGALGASPAMAEETRPAPASTPAASPAAASEVAPLVLEADLAAPVEEVWKIFSTAEGFKRLGVAQCEFDLRIGGLIRTHYDPKGVLGDGGTIVSEILAYEPLRMIAFRIRKPPETFPFAEESWKNTWSVATFTDLGGGRTHLRLTGLGYTNTPDSQAMREFFAKGNAWVLQHLQKQFEAVAAADGAAQTGDPLAPVRVERTVDLPRSEVWSLLSTPAGWQRFFGVTAEIELRPGGAFVVRFSSNAPAGEQGSEGCTVLSFVPEEMLSFTWNAPPKFAKARAQRTWVVIRLDALEPSRTRVRLEHLGFAEQAAASPGDRGEWEQVRAYFTAAWPTVVGALAEQAPDKAKAPDNS